MRSCSTIALSCLALGIAAVTSYGAEALLDTQEIGIEFKESDIDLKNDTVTFRGGVRVTQGVNSIRAEEGTARAFRSDNKRWEFRDSVFVRTADAQLSSQTATAAFENNVLVEARAEGSPAHFERVGGAASERLARGEARVIDYDVATETITLTGDVWFGYGQDEFEGEKVTYSIRDGRVRVNGAGESGRVRGIIRPRTSEKERDDDNAPAQAPEAGGTQTGKTSTSMSAGERGA
jgi:lipopolysaccharide transport protein LptA